MSSGLDWHQIIGIRRKSWLESNDRLGRMGGGRRTAPGEEGIRTPPKGLDSSISDGWEFSNLDVSIPDDVAVVLQCDVPPRFARPMPSISANLLASTDRFHSSLPRTISSSGTPLRKCSMRSFSTRMRARFHSPAGFTRTTCAGLDIVQIARSASIELTIRMAQIV